MPYKIAIASGKGGTGKTTLAVNLSYMFYTFYNETVQLVDCDVEEPNDALFFSSAIVNNEKKAFQLIPKIDVSACTFCGKCVDHCVFNAITVIPSVNFAEVNGSLCHSCGACKIACKAGAITEEHQSIGEIVHYSVDSGYNLLQGSLKITSSMQTLLIKTVKTEIKDSSDIIILDSPPGTSCAVVETISDADLVIIVTEPTPFGIHDLKLLVNVLNKLKKPFKVVINKAGIGNDAIYQILKNQKIEIIGEIPFCIEYASLYARGKIIDEMPTEMVTKYLEITAKLENEINIHEGNNYFKW